MPWHWEPTKDATNGETLRGAVSELRSAGIRMRQLTGLEGRYRMVNT
jgi:hypothetical protein